MILDVKNLHHSYGEVEALNNLNFSIKDSSIVSVLGPSCCGKTTLMKIMLGLLQPSSGRILLDGKDITQLGLKNYRKYIAAVMQDDTLLAGSIADNICFFEPQENHLKIQQSLFYFQLPLQ